MKHAEILVVDDDFDVRDSLSDIITDEGYTVACVADGLEALDYLRENAPPCVILLDWMMPRCDGAEFRVRQRRDPSLAEIPVVLLTADAGRPERLESVGADSFLTKPVDLERLFETMRRYCGEPKG